MSDGTAVPGDVLKEEKFWKKQDSEDQVRRATDGKEKAWLGISEPYHFATVTLAINAVKIQWLIYATNSSDFINLLLKQQ